MPLNGSKKIRYRFTIALLVVTAAVCFGFFRQEQIVKDLESETRERTTQACLNQAATRESLRQTLLEIIGTFPPTERTQSITDTINRVLEPLVCPQKNTIVIPEITSTGP